MSIESLVSDRHSKEPYFSGKITFFNSSLPFNWNTKLGYVIALVIEAIDASTISLCGVPVICFFVGSCWLLKVIIEDITNDLSKLSAITVSTENHIKVEMLFCTFVQSFSKAEQLSSKKK